MKNTKQTSHQIIVETVVPLTKELETSVKTLCKEKFGTEKFEHKINPSILGGVRITVDSTRYDASLKAKLDSLITSN